jgi:putative transposase
VNERVTRSRELVARGFALAAVTRVLQVSPQAIYRTPAPRRPPQRRPPAGPVEQAIVEVAEANQTDGYRGVAALTRQKLGIAVNRKRVLRVMGERKLIQRRPRPERRRRPGFFRVERPRQLWQLDMTPIWVAEHGWCYPKAIIDRRTREIVAWGSRCAAADEAIAVVDQAVRGTGSCPASSSSEQTTDRRSPPAASARTSADSRSVTAAAATATPRARRSSSPGSGSSKIGRSG